ncbi:unnamed protein product [Darwinula stevensoni]|uniref:Uncharacterized protein n=1 Tax=Darwinula stevensoni TaxID=69355 RepID=A0A7R9FQT4_9CRUS|nr:unnamed protein product [Darwinula stevensoni]CAG0899739.1 unnamed protein product [Darwinula stevensoni]
MEKLVQSRLSMTNSLERAKALEKSNSITKPKALVLLLKMVPTLMYSYIYPD